MCRYVCIMCERSCMYVECVQVCVGVRKKIDRQRDKIERERECV